MSTRSGGQSISEIELQGREEFLSFAAELGYSQVMAMFVVDGCRADGAADPYVAARFWMSADESLFPRPRLPLG